MGEQGQRRKQTRKAARKLPGHSYVMMKRY
jgi:hypothetical protein